MNDWMTANSRDDVKTTNNQGMEKKVLYNKHGNLEKRWRQAKEDDTMKGSWE